MNPDQILGTRSSPVKPVKFGGGAHPPPHEPSMNMAMLDSYHHRNAIYKERRENLLEEFNDVEVKSLYYACAENLIKLYLMKLKQDCLATGIYQNQVAKFISINCFLFEK